MKKILPVLFVLPLFFAACAPSALSNTQAEAGRPDSAKVTQVSIPYQPSRPKAILIVEPIRTSSSVTTWSNNEASQVPVADKMAAQLTTALAKVGNFVLYQPGSNVSIKKGEVGPYLVRATLTEFNELADAESNNTDVGLGGAGAVLGIAGAIANKPGLMWTGAGLAIANPEYHDGSASTKGMVAFDVQIIEKKTGRIVDSFDASGIFKSASSSRGIGLFGISNQQSKFSSSAIGQALRAAMNDVVQKTHDTLL